MIWFALALAIVTIVLAGGFGWAGRKTRQELGAAREKIEELEKNVVWYKNALKRRADSRPSLDELSRVFPSEDSSGRGPS